MCPRSYGRISSNGNMNVHDPTPSLTKSTMTFHHESHLRNPGGTRSVSKCHPWWSVAPLHLRPWWYAYVPGPSPTPVQSCHVSVRGAQSASQTDVGNHKIRHAHTPANGRKNTLFESRLLVYHAVAGVPNPTKFVSTMHPYRWLPASITHSCPHPRITSLT